MSKQTYVPPTIKRNVTGVMNKFGRQSRVCDRVAGVPVDELLEAHGSPLFAYDEGMLREKYREAQRAFSKRYPKVQFAWSYKTNYLNAICRVFHSEGSIAEVVSDFEYEKSRALGVPGDQIIINGPDKPYALLKRAVAEGARIHLDNLDELLTLEQLTQDNKETVKVGIRVNMDTGMKPAWTKFGFNLENGEAARAIRRIASSRRLKLVGLHTHVGTFVLEPAYYAVAVQKLIALAIEAESRGEMELEYLDLGGGFASRNTLHSQYLPGEQVVPTFDDYAESICTALHTHLPVGKQPMLFLETGRALVDEAGYLLSSVIATKQKPDGGRAIVIDAGVNLLYTVAWYRLSILPAQDFADGLSDTTVYGPLCMNIDVVRDQTPLPSMQLGDKVVLHPVGAYNITQAMQFITYRPAVVLISEAGQVDVIREKENLDYVQQLERLPERLAEKKS
jgi:diaminopimelate decarboxylase